MPTGYHVWNGVNDSILEGRKQPAEANCREHDGRVETTPGDDRRPLAVALTLTRSYARL